MIAVAVKTELQPAKLEKAVEKAAYRNFGHAAASLSKDVKNTLQTAPGPSVPGKPPHTHKGAYLRRAIRYAADKEGAVIGPVASLVGTSGAAHEFGGRYRSGDYPQRPFMQPALERALPRFGGEWAGSIGT